jgi:hypothetical protein
MNAISDKQKSVTVRDYPPIVITPEPDNIGRNVWCGNEVVRDFMNRDKETGT